MGEGGWGVSARVRERALRGAGEARFLSPACSHRFRCRPTRTGRRGSKGSTILGSRPPLPAHWSAQGTPLPAPSPARIGTCAPSLSYHAQARKCPRGCVRAQRTAINPCLATVRGRRVVISDARRGRVSGIVQGNGVPARWALYVLFERRYPRLIVRSGHPIPCACCNEQPGDTAAGGMGEMP